MGTSLQKQLNATASRSVGDVDARQSVMTCSAFISTSTTVVTLVSQNPVSYSIYELIQTVLTVTITCTETEKTQIKSVSSSVSQAITMVQAEVTHTKEVYASVNGEEVSDADIAAAPLCKTEADCDSLVTFPADTATTASAPSPAPAPAPSPAPTPASDTSSMQTAVPMTSVPSSPEETSPPPPIMTTASSKREARRYGQHMMRRRMVQTLI